MVVVAAGQTTVLAVQRKPEAPAVAVATGELAAGCSWESVEASWLLLLLLLVVAGGGQDELAVRLKRATDLPVGCVLLVGVTVANTGTCRDTSAAKSQ
jgi:uncharacterized integral membrane protein